MKAKIREKLQQAGLALLSPVTPIVEGGFAERCVAQIMEGKYFTTKQLAKLFDQSTDWVLDNFAEVKGKFQLGRVILYPEDGVKAIIRSKMNL